MQRLAGKACNDRTNVVRQFVRLGEERPPVGLVADKRVADMGHMDADLVRPARFQPTLHQRGRGCRVGARAELVDKGVMRDGVACVAASVRNDGAFRAVRSRPSQRRVDGAGRAGRRSPDHGMVGAFQITGASVVGEGLRQGTMGKIVLGDDENAARVLVEAMNDAGSAYAADSRKRFTAMVDQGVDERARPVARAGMDDEADLLVDNDQIVVLIKNRELDILAQRFGRFRLRHSDANDSTRNKLGFRFLNRLAVHMHVAGTDQCLDAAAGQVGAGLRGQPLIEAHTCGIFPDMEDFQTGSGFAIRGAHLGNDQWIFVMTERVAQEPNQDEPLDPAVEKVRAKLMRFVVINLGILFLALMAVVGALVYRSVSTGSADTASTGPGLSVPPEGSIISGEIALPANAQILSQSLAGSRMTMLVEISGAREIVVYDIDAARIIARFAITAE